MKNVLGVYIVPGYVIYQVPVEPAYEDVLLLYLIQISEALLEIEALTN
jgi:hypothetical protein